MAQQDLFERLDAFIETHFDEISGASQEQIIAVFLQQNPDIDPQTFKHQAQAFAQNSQQAAQLIPELLADALDGKIQQNNNPSSQPTTALSPGQILDHYRIINKLADGGMGEVYLAERADGSFNKQVALKILSKGLITDEAIQRFFRERQILAHLKHPNIASLLDAGVTEKNRPWFALEFIEGERIDHYCHNNGLNTEQKVKLFDQVCQAMSYAHAQGIIHRDLKPPNILIDTATDEARPIILDFGVAALQDEQAMTSTGQIIGTPGFMSPEQTSGKTALMDARSDVFSLGVVLYQLLTGQHPFKAESITDTNFKVIKESVPLLPRSQFNPDLAAIVYQCLAKDPANRYQSVKQLHLDLNRYLQGDPVQARKISMLQRLRKKIRQHPWISALSGGLVLVTISAGLLLFWQQWQNIEHRNTVQKYAFISKELQQKVREQHMLPWHPLDQTYAEVIQTLQSMKTDIKGNETLNNGPVFATLGQVYLLMNQTKQAVNAFQQYAASGYSNADTEIQYALAMASLWEAEQAQSMQIADETARKQHQQDILTRYLQPSKQKLTAYLHESRQATYLQAQLAYLENDFTLAIRLAEQAYVEDAAHYEALRLAGLATLQKGKYLAIDGQAKAALVDYERALDFLQRSIEIGRSDLLAHHHLCELHEIRMHAYLIGSEKVNNELYQQVILACENSEQLLNGQLKAVINLAEVYSSWYSWLSDIDQENPAVTQAMLTYAKKALEMAPNDTDALARMVAALLHVSREANQELSSEDKRSYLDQARQYAIKSVEINDQDAYNWANLADIYYTQANRNYQQEDITPLVESAVAAYQKSQDLLPSYAWIYMMGESHLVLGVYRNQQAQYQAAGKALVRSIELLQNAVTEAPDFSTGWRKLTEANIELIQAHQQLGLPIETLLKQAEHSLGRTCETYAKRGDFPNSINASITFLQHQQININATCPLPVQSGNDTINSGLEGSSNE